jgi:predicted GTPase
LYAADLPTLRQTTVATFADNTAVLASHSDPKIASNLLQKNLDKIQNWLKILRISANETKSIHVTFTMKKETCPPVILMIINCHKQMKQSILAYTWTDA